MKAVVQNSSRLLVAVAVLASQAFVGVALLASVSRAEGLGFPRLTQASEPLPLPPQTEQVQEDSPLRCLEIKDPPLSALSTDIQPRTADGQIVANENLPADCSQGVFTDKQYMQIDLACDSCRPRWCDLLGFANFCHNPLYFEEVCLERCGVRSCCCQPTASAACFFGGALLMPIRAVCACPCSCVPAHYGCP